MSSGEYAPAWECDWLSNEGRVVKGPVFCALWKMWMNPWFPPSSWNCAILNLDSDQFPERIEHKVAILAKDQSIMKKSPREAVLQDFQLDALKCCALLCPILQSHTKFKDWVEKCILVLSEQTDLESFMVSVLLYLRRWYTAVLEHCVKLGLKRTFLYLGYAVPPLLQRENN